MAAETGIAEDHWVEAACRHLVKNFLDTDCPIRKAPISSGSFTVARVVQRIGWVSLSLHSSKNWVICSKAATLVNFKIPDRVVQLSLNLQNCAFHVA